jgi:hypothetical protein
MRIVIDFLLLSAGAAIGMFAMCLMQISSKSDKK